jgi:glycosyltransferase involved in cell wall biosynthesis
LGWALRGATQGSRVIVQNPEDGVALAGFGIDPARIVLIRGSGVDIGHFAPLPEPLGPTVTVALVARMLRSKGVLDAVAAIRRLRAEGFAVELVLAGSSDPDNRDSLSDELLSQLADEPGIEWLGRVADVRMVWARAAIAVLPSTYGEGLPRALLEAAACGRPIVATDLPGCREVVRDGENGMLVPPHDVPRLAEAIAGLARDPARRRAMGRAGRALVEREFAESVIAEQTLALYRAVLSEKTSC